MIFLPSAFTLATSKDHCGGDDRLALVPIKVSAVLVRRPATWGKHLEGRGEPRFTYGHSMIVDPWGHVTAKVSDGTGWATTPGSTTSVAACVVTMPVLEHRKRV